MPRSTPGLFALCVLVAAAPGQAAEPPVTFRQFHMDVVVGPGGRAVSTVHMEALASNDGAAREIAQQAMAYVDGLERVELVEGYTLKADGRRVPVAEGAVRTQLAPGSPNSPQYSDLKRVVAVFPDVQAGDAVALTWRKTIDEPIFPGHVSQTSFFSRTLPWQDVRIRITAPLDQPLQTESFGPVMDVVEAEGQRTYTWRYSAPAVIEDRAALSPLDRAPRLFASTFANWNEFGQAWAALIEPKLAPTPRIQALADEVTRGVDDPRAQTEALYAWVSRHIRWVALYVGVGSFVPHPADQVLANGYGDCKDQVILLLALLRAKGIAAEPALISASPTYRLSGPATLSAFNHVIAYVPQFDLYADTTARGAPFGTIPSQLYGKPTLHVRRDRSELRRTPVLAPGVATMRTRMVAKLDDSGHVAGVTTTEAAGPFATVLRNVAERMQGQGTERAVAEQLRNLGQSGSGDLTMARLDRVGPDYRVEGSFRLNAHPDWLTGEPFLMPTGLRLLARPGDGLLGSMAVRNLPLSEATPCYAGEQREELSLALPPGRHPGTLPLDRRIDAADFTYQSHWTFTDENLKVERIFVSRIAQPLCEGKLRGEADRAMNQIRRDLDMRVSLAED